MTLIEAKENDLLQQLGALPVAGELVEARAQRDAATRHTQGSYQILFETPGESAPDLATRLQIAVRVALLNEDRRLAEHYNQQFESRSSAAAKESPALVSALAYAERVTLKPASSTPADLQAMLQAGWSVPATITLAQVVAFVNFQTRLLTGLRLLAGEQALPVQPAPVAAGSWSPSKQTASGRAAPDAFTQKELDWEPWLPPRAIGELSPDEGELLEKFGQLDSDYFRLLAHNLPLLEQRTLTDRGIFFTPAGLPRADRELAAAVTSKVNGCIFCASVHARKASQLSKRSGDVEQLLATPPGIALAEGFEPRWQALIDFAAQLAATPARATAESLARLSALDLDTLALLDLVQSVAFFPWANRLMLSLGEPFWPQEPQS